LTHALIVGKGGDRGWGGGKWCRGVPEWCRHCDVLQRKNDESTTQWRKFYRAAVTRQGLGTGLRIRQQHYDVRLRRGDATECTDHTARYIRQDPVGLGLNLFL